MTDQLPEWCKEAGADIDNYLVGDTDWLFDGGMTRYKQFRAALPTIIAKHAKPLIEELASLKADLAQTLSAWDAARKAIAASEADMMPRSYVLQVLDDHISEGETK